MARLKGVALPVKTQKQRDALVGKRVTFLRWGDIDRSGRGYIFPKSGTVSHVLGKNVFLECGEILWTPQLVELVEVGERA